LTELILGAKERIEKEWHELLGSVGLKIISIRGRKGFHALIEAVKA